LRTRFQKLNKTAYSSVYKNQQIIQKNIISTKKAYESQKTRLPDPLIHKTGFQLPAKIDIVK
jgi:hypothetical protein